MDSKEIKKLLGSVRVRSINGTRNKQKVTYYIQAWKQHDSEDVFSNELRTRALKVIYGEDFTTENAGSVHAGNVSSKSISMTPSQWDILLN